MKWEEELPRFVRQTDLVGCPCEEETLHKVKFIKQK